MPISSHHLLFNSPPFPKLEKPPGRQNRSPEFIISAGKNTKIRWSQTTPRPLLFTGVFPYPWRSCWYFLSSEFAAHRARRCRPKATVAWDSPSACRHRWRPPQRHPFKRASSPSRSARRPVIHHHRRPPEHHRRPPPGPLPRRSWPPWNPRWASPLSFLLHR
jgi:hypothetical protein